MKYGVSTSLAILALAGCAIAQHRPAADVIITNAKVWTVDGTRPQAEALGIIGQRIVALGSSAEMDAWRGAETNVIDAAGKLVLPGFNDAHVHFLDGSSNLTNVQLKGADSPEEFARRIAEFAKKLPKSDWVLGGNWDD